jgi:FixJ family two-component response regulator
MADSVAVATAAGAVEFLAKPIRMDSLLAVLDRRLHTVNARQTEH